MKKNDVLDVFPLLRRNTVNEIFNETMKIECENR